MTFDATINPVAYEGGKAVFIDTEYDTWNMDPKALENAKADLADLKGADITYSLLGDPFSPCA